MSFEINIKEQEVYVSGKFTYSFPYTIKNYIIADTLVIFLLEIPFDVVFNENVFCIDFAKSSMLWQVEKHEEHNKICPFTSISIANNKLIGYKWCGIQCEIDFNTGKIISTELIK
jgi:hypothetical protein